MRTSCLFLNDALDETSKARCNKYVVVIGSSGARSKTQMDIYDYQGEKKGKFNFAGTDKIYATWDSGRNFIWLMIKGSGQMRGVAFKSGKSPTFKVSCNYSEHGKRLKGGCFLPQKGCQVMEYVIADSWDWKVRRTMGRSGLSALLFPEERRASLSLVFTHMSFPLNKIWMQHNGAKQKLFQGVRR